MRGGGGEGASPLTTKQTTATVSNSGRCLNKAVSRVARQDDKADAKLHDTQLYGHCIPTASQSTGWSD